jgi:molybdopterin converting factor small subunit
VVRIRVRALGTLRKVTGKGYIEMILPDGADVKQVIEFLIKRYRGLEEFFLDMVTKSPVPNAIILLNGVEIGNLMSLGTPINNGSTLTLLPVTHGG